MPSVLRQRQGQGGLEGGFLIDAVVLEDRKWGGGAGRRKGPDKPFSGLPRLSTHPKPVLPLPGSPLPVSVTQVKTEPLQSWGHRVTGVRQTVLWEVKGLPSCGITI